jgi:hypothetical protein
LIPGFDSDEAFLVYAKAFCEAEARQNIPMGSQRMPVMKPPSHYNTLVKKKKLRKS